MCPWKTPIFFYLPDVAEFPMVSDALRECSLYVGDGVTIRRMMARKKNGTPIGHAPVAAQLGWCEAAGVCCATFTIVGRRSCAAMGDA